MPAREPEYDSLSLEDRERVYARLAQQVGGVWDSVPEPKVGRMLQRNIKKTYNEALLVSNSAGLRDEREYVRKDKNTFRIVLLGDSFVMGAGGPERNRLGTQMEAMLEDLYGTIGGKTIEVYSVGLGSWNMMAEATYLSSRLSAYQPDIIIAILHLE